MTLKTYQAPTMAECLAEVKRDLGRDAVILHTRTVRKRGLLGLFRRCLWEVTASPNVNVPEPMSKGQYVAEAQSGAAAAEPKAEKHAAMPAQGQADAPREVAPAKAAAPLTHRVDDIHRMLKELLSRPPAEGGRRPALPVELEEFHRCLVGQDVGGDIVADLIQQLCMNLTGQQLGDRELIHCELGKLLAARIRTAGDEPRDQHTQTQRARVIALVGPTGVGKTTTIAKLAANYKLCQGKRVGLITMDTFRIAAVEQLRTYANIIEVPIRPVLTTGELDAVLNTMRDLDVVLMDTAGRSQNNRLRLSQLRSFVTAASAGKARKREHPRAARTGPRSEDLIANVRTLGRACL
jgi:flagellar biosynthesis protein FlhF